MSTAALNWYHLADSAFPTGGFAFSSGVEAAAKLGLFTCRQQFTDFLRTAMSQLACYEMAFLTGCYTGAKPTDMITRYHAGMTAPSICRASLIQGRSLLRSLEHLLGENALPHTRSLLSIKPDRRHFLLVYGWGLQELGMDAAEARRCLLYINLRDWISAAIRLGSIGPMEGHRIQHQLLREGDHLLTR
jgi:urease accessory protein